MRIGHGYDVHRFCEGRPLMLGGVNIPYEIGLLGHSDADVLLHAICDALLGAASKGDIGKHFPDSDSKFKDINSILLLRSVKELLEKEGFSVVNIDATVIAQSPRLAPFINDMVKNIAETLEIEEVCVNVKATTEEGLGFTGNKQGIAAHCVCLIE